MTLKLYKFTDAAGLKLIKPYVPAISISITKRFYTFGEFEIKVTLDHFTEFKNDLIVGLDYDFYGIIKKRIKNESNSENTATISGYCIKYLTQKRECVVLNDENTDVLGYDEISGSTEYCMKHYVNAHIVNPTDNNRKICNISIAENQNRGTAADAYYARYTAVSEILYNLGHKAKLGYNFKLNNTGTGFIFDVLEPRNRTVNQSTYQPVILEVGKGLISKTHEINNEDAANTFYCTRTGYEFEDEAFTQLLYSNNEKAGYEREEHALNIDVDSDAEDIYEDFANNAQKEIENYETSEAIECKIDKRLDIRLGDIVTISSDGVKFDRQLTEIQYTITGDTHNITGTFGDKYLTKFERNSRAAQKANDIAVDNAHKIKNHDKSLKYLQEKLPTYDEQILSALELMAGSLSFYAWEYAEVTDGWPAGRYISATPKTSATKDTEVWLQNANGYAHYPNGINGAPDTGMTKDSTIIARLVAAGIVTADAVQTGILKSKDGRCWINLDEGTFHFESDTPPPSCPIIGGRVFKYASDGTLSPSTITLTAVPSDVTVQKWQYQTAAGAWVDYPVGTITGNTLSISPSHAVFYNDTAQIRVLTSDQSVSETVVILKVRDGAAGAQGTQGINLVAKSDITYSNTTYRVHQYDLTTPLEIGKVYTCTIWGELGDGKSSFRVYSGYTSSSVLGYFSKKINGTYSTSFAVTGNDVPTADAAKLLTIYAYPSSVTGATSKIEKIKLELGECIDPVWTPAPQDLVGATGATGKGISSVTNYYLASTSSSGVTTSTSGWTTTVQSVSASKKYLWNYEKITYTDNTTTSTPPCVIGAYGDTGATGTQGAKGDKGDTGEQGTQGINIVANSDTEYATSDYLVHKYHLTTPLEVDKKYTCTIWGELGTGKSHFNVYSGEINTAAMIDPPKKQEGVYSASFAVKQNQLPNADAANYINIYAWPSSITGATSKITKIKLELGEVANPIWTPAPQDLVGAPGAPGKGILSEAHYYLASALASGVTTSTAGWTTQPQTTTTTNKYLWYYAVITYTDNTTHTRPPCIIGTHGATGAQGVQGKPGIDYSQGKAMFEDPIFAVGNNNCNKYANAGDGNVTISRVARSADNPFPASATEHEFKIVTTGTASPGMGGIAQYIPSRANAVFIRRVIAKIPVGRNLHEAQNSMGDGYKIEWLTSTAGTGKFAEYIYKYTCGATGTFSTGGHMYLLGGPAATAENPVEWRIAYCQTFDMTNTSDINKLQKNAVIAVNMQYALGTSTTTAPTSGWQGTPPTWQDGKYMWQKKTTVYADGRTVTDNPVCISGATGQQGPAGNNYWRSVAWIDVSGSEYDVNKWYPVIGTALESNGVLRIKVSVQLNSGTKPAWSSHNNGYSVDFDIQTQRNGWGTTDGETLIFCDTFKYCSVSPISYRQLRMGSLPVLYMRGGGKYTVSTDYPCTWTPHTQDYTWTSGQYSEIATVLTSRPAPEGKSIQGAAGRTYFLEPSALAIKRGANAVLMPSTVKFSAYYRDGASATRTAYAGRFVIAESTDGTTYTNKYTSAANEAAKEYTPTSSATLVRCTMYAAGGTTTALDIATIPILTDVSGIQSILDDMELDFDAKYAELKKYTDNVSSSASAEISQNKDSIGIQAKQISTAQNDVLVLQQQLESLLDLTAGSLQVSINEMSTIVANISGNLTEIVQKLQTYFHFGLDGLTIRKNENGTDQPFNTFIDNKTIQFRYNNSVVAYINNNQLYVPDAVVERLAIGSSATGYFIWQVEPNGSLTLKRRSNA